MVAFQLIDGRVYHQNLELVFPKATIRTSGSVGLDGTLSLVAEMPVPKHWFGTGRAAAALGQQTIRIPIGGTLSGRNSTRRHCARKAKASCANQPATASGRRSRNNSITCSGRDAERRGVEGIN